MEYFLASFDFDGTIANTFEPSPQGLGIYEVHDLVIEKMFGERGLEVYRRTGGLQNMAPSELVASLLENLDSSLNFEETLEDFVGKKLKIYMTQIGTRFPNGQVWPRPTTGFLDFWQALENKDLCISTAIISSGHRDFIERTFEVWDTKVPDILVTEETIRERHYPVPLEAMFKPGLLPFALAHRAWLGSKDISARSSKKNVVYFGDDPKKDLEMARRAGIAFGLYTQKPQEEVGYGFSFSNWDIITQKLKTRQILVQAA